MSHFSYYAVLEYDKSFADLAGHWAEQGVKELTAKHIVNGTSDTKFSPHQPLTRAQFAAMLVRALGLESTQGAAFTDVDGDAWYASAVAAASQHGLVNGRGKETFAPNAAITREELAVMLYRAYQTKGDASSLEGAPDLKDNQQISPWTLQEVNEALALGDEGACEWHVYASSQDHPCGKRASHAESVGPVGNSAHPADSRNAGMGLEGRLRGMTWDRVAI